MQSAVIKCSQQEGLKVQMFKVILQPKYYQVEPDLVCV